jgi:hypothetical protein
MTELSSADLCKLTLQEVADLLLEKLDEVDHTRSSCKVYGCCDGRMFELCLVMKEVDKDGDD